jgi:hypothetical protein
VSFYYLSNPYNGDPETRAERARLAAHACALLLRQGLHAWSPIVHNHAMMGCVEFSLEERRELMLPFDFTLLRAARGMIVFTLPGWRESYGVGQELALCAELGLPVHYLAPEDLARGEARLRERPLDPSNV